MTQSYHVKSLGLGNYDLGHLYGHWYCFLVNQGFSYFIIAGALGFGGVAAAAAEIAQVFFYLFVILFLVFVVLWLIDRRGPPLKLVLNKSKE